MYCALPASVKPHERMIIMPDDSVIDETDPSRVAFVRGDLTGMAVPAHPDALALPHPVRRRIEAAPQREGEIELADPAPVQQAAVQRARLVAPEPAIVDIRVPVAQGDVVGILLQKALDGGLVREEAGCFLFQLCPERWGAGAFRHELRTGPREFPVAHAKPRIGVKATVLSVLRMASNWVAISSIDQSLRHTPSVSVT
jgi:hypothetical protein